MQAPRRCLVPIAVVLLASPCNQLSRERLSREAAVDFWSSSSPRLNSTNNSRAGRIVLCAS